MPQFVLTIFRYSVGDGEINIFKFSIYFLYVKLYEILIKRYLGVPSGSDDNDRLPFVLCLLCGSVFTQVM